MCCTIQDIFMLCVICGLTRMLVVVDIGTHNKFLNFNFKLHFERVCEKKIKRMIKEMEVY
jgi:hypothetical protein